MNTGVLIDGRLWVPVKPFSDYWTISNLTAVISDVMRFHPINHGESILLREPRKMDLSTPFDPAEMVEMAIVVTWMASFEESARCPLRTQPGRTRAAPGGSGREPIGSGSTCTIASQARMSDSFRKSKPCHDRLARRDRRGT